MIRVGIMGLGQITYRVAKGICYAESAELYAAGSRSLERAGESQRLYGTQKIYDSYERPLQGPQVETVYICTPNHLHFEHIQNVLHHGKRVLCERSLVVSAEQLKECFELARSSNLFLMEVEKTLLTPLNRKLKQLVKEGVIGQLRYVEGSYSYPVDLSEVEEDHLRFPEEVGDSIYDIDVYPICYAN